MYKWIGYVLIIAACSGIGISKGQEMERHLEALEELKKLFYLLRSELKYTRAPFAELFQKISPKVAEPYSNWLRRLSQRLRGRGTGTFEEVWHTSIEEDLTEQSLKAEELEELKSIGKSLEYPESLDLYIAQLEYKIKHTREVYQSKKKLYRSMGIMCGIFLVVLLL